MSSIGSLLVLEGSDVPHCAGGFWSRWFFKIAFSPSRWKTQSILFYCYPVIFLKFFHYKSLYRYTQCHKINSFCPYCNTSSGFPKSLWYSYTFGDVVLHRNYQEEREKRKKKYIVFFFFVFSLPLSNIFFHAFMCPVTLLSLVLHSVKNIVTASSYCLALKRYFSTWKTTTTKMTNNLFKYFPRKKKKIWSHWFMKPWYSLSQISS